MRPSEDPHAGKIVINRMTSRAARRPRALHPGYARLDERGLPELLDFAVKTASLVHYYAPTNTRDGDFRAFFMADPAMVLASILTIPTGAMEASFARLTEEAKRARGDGARLDKLREIVWNILGLAQLVDRLHRSLQGAVRGGPAEDLLSAIESSIDGPLRDALQRLRGVGAGAEALGRPILVPVHGLSGRWRAEPTQGDSVYRGETPREKIDGATRALGDVLSVFLGEIERLTALAEARFPEVLAEGQKRPHLALFLAFARLFHGVKGSADDLSGRLVDFYHREVLREGPRGPVGDSAYLTFTLAPDKGVTSALVPAGARFSAGKDRDGRDIVFATEGAIRVSAAKLERARALRVTRGSLLPRSNEDDVPLQALSTEIALGQGPFLPFGEPAPSAHAPSAHAPSAQGASVTTLATLGFAVASPDLRLRGGERTIRVFLRFTEASMAGLRDELDRIAEATGARATDVLRSALRGAFALTISTQAGFLPTGPHEVVADDGVLGDREIGLQIVLPPTFPPVGPLDPQAPEAPASPPLPMLRAHLQQERVDLDLNTPRALGISVLALSLLAGLRVEAVWLEIEVRDLTDATLASPAGPIAPGQPFFPLGSAPGVGAYLSIHHPEIFEKRPDAIGLSIEWFHLPADEGGFAAYYREYRIGVDGASRRGLLHNRSFKASFHVAEPGDFVLGPDAEDRYLFRTEESQEPDAPDASGKLRAMTAFPWLTPAPVARPAGYDPDKSALVMTLTEPLEGFGDTVYPKNVVAAIKEPEGDEGRCEEACALAQKPLLDAANLLGSAIDLCGSKADDRDCQRCFSSSLGVCRSMLLGAVATALDKALGEGAGAAKPEALAALDEAAQAAKSATGDARRPAVERWLGAARDALGPFVTGGTGSAGSLAERLWDALTCIEACEAEAKGRDVKAKMVPCLTQCREALTKAHDEGVKACIDACKAAPKEPIVPRVPWLPAAKRVWLDYTRTSFVLGSPSSEQAGSFWHLVPFGDLAPAPGDGGDRPVRLLPETPPGGALLLGFRGLAPLPLPLLVHLTSSGDAENEAWPKVVWEILVNGAFQPLSVVDGTGGLRRTGIVVARVPEGVSADLTWIRVVARAGERRFPRVVAVTPHAALATWRDEGNTGAHLEVPRPAGSIKAPLDKLAHIATVTQPIASWGGRPPETVETLPVRLGERLRHKGRAVMGWDYERLALDAFPTIDRVLALPARGPRGAAPGEVTVVVMPSSDPAPSVINRTPSFDPDTLAEVAESLLARTSPFVKVHVRNPVYVEITVTARVELAPSADPGSVEAYLVEVLSPSFPDPPWASLGFGYPTEDDIADLLRARPDVVSVLDVRFDYRPDPAGLDWYYLTSAPSHHVISALADDSVSDEGEGGLCGLA
jgi:hypothetical protein